VGHVGSQQVEHVVLGLKHFCLAVLSKIVDREDGAILVVEGDSIMGEQQYLLFGILLIFTPNSHNLLRILKKSGVLGNNIFEGVTVFVG